MRKLLYYKLRMFVLPSLLRYLGWRQAARLSFAAETVALQPRGRGYKDAVIVRAGTSDVEAFWGVFVHAGYAVPEQPRNVRLIIDAGANAGYAAVWFAAGWPNSRIIAVEPEASNAAICRRNCAPYPNIEVVEAALWPRPGHVRIKDPSAGKWAFAVEEAADGIPAVTINDLANGAPIDLLKIDIEGAERELFSKPPSWLSRVRLLIVETETHKPPTRTVVTSALEQAGRQWYLHGNCVVSVHDPCSV